MSKPRMTKPITNIRLSPTPATLEIIVCENIVQIREPGGMICSSILTITPRTGAVHVTGKQPYDIYIYHGDLSVKEEH